MNKKLLKDDEERRKEVKNYISNIIQNLDLIDSVKAFLMAKWLSKKSEYYKKHFQGAGFGDSPKGIVKGDIIRVQFGYNIGDELSEEFQDCHFSLVWARKGFLLVVIPLTKTPQEGNEFAVNLGKINGLPDSENVDTWAKLEGIKSVSIRRVYRMREYTEGKISIKDNKELMKKVNDKMIELFIEIS